MGAMKAILIDIMNYERCAATYEEKKNCQCAACLECRASWREKTDAPKFILDEVRK
jgi:hypothetical protein